MKQDIIDSLSILNPKINDIRNVYTFIGNSAYFRVNELIEEKFKDSSPLWSQLPPRYRREMLNFLYERVKEMDIDLSLCEDDWIGTHLLKRCYQNKEKYLSKKVFI